MQKRKTSLVTWLLLGIFAIGAVNVLIGAFSEKTPEQIAADAARKADAAEAYKRDIAIITAERSVRSRLKDPESAQFSDSIYTVGGYVCGMVNARNSFGAYSGQQAFMMAGDGVIARLEDRKSVV
jgi:hypothetical protein